MTFQDLPADWPTRPVTDPEITADLLDLVVGERDRAVGALGILVCAPGGRLAQPVVIPGAPPDATTAERRNVFDVVCQGIVRASGRGSGAGILVAVARPGGPLVTHDDRRWRRAAELACHDHGVELLGTWLVTPALIRPMPARTAPRRSA